VTKVEFEVLTQAPYSVVHVPGARYPGIVVRGETLAALVAAAKDLVNELREEYRPVDEAQYLANELATMFDHYAITLDANGIGLPEVHEP
jgi:hypothetical protein